MTVLCCLKHHNLVCHHIVRNDIPKQSLLALELGGKELPDFDLELFFQFMMKL
jgi:hypothetical protein